jgi:hypothetical protein
MKNMGSEEVKNTIQRLADNDANRSATARLADIIDEVELALSKGVKRQAIIETLKEHGLVFTLNSFKAARRRINSRRAASPK